jgi:hypothetical protein
VNWLQRLIKGLGRRGSNAPLSFDEWLATPPPKIAAAINRHLDREIDREITRRRGSNPPAPGNKPAAPAGPPTKPQPTGGRLIYTDRDPGPVPPRLPGDLADLPVLTAERLDGAPAAPAPAEMPSDELLDQWVQEARRVHITSGYHINPSTTMARLAIAWARQQQAQSLQLPPPDADPVATDGDLLKVGDRIFWADDARRAIYARGRADERTAILRALGVQP